MCIGITYNCYVVGECIVEKKQQQHYPKVKREAKIDTSESDSFKNAICIWMYMVYIILLTLNIWIYNKIISKKIKNYIPTCKII